MDLVNLLTGQYIHTIQWTGKNVKAIKHFLTTSVSTYFGNFYNGDACSFLSCDNVHLQYQSTLNHSLTISYQKNNNSMHHIITIPIHDYIIFHPYIDNYSKCITTISSHDIKNGYSKPNITKHGFVDNKTGVHYIGYQWNGSLADFPSDINQCFQDANDIIVMVDNKHHSLHLQLPNETNSKAKELLIKPYYWLLLKAGDDIDDNLYFNDYRVVSPSDSIQKYHVPKTIKLPKYLFTVTEATGDYSDVDTEVIGTSSTYVGAEKIMAKAEDLYSNIHDKMEDDAMFDIAPTKTRGFNKNDIFTN